MPLRKKQNSSEAQRPRRIETTRYKPDYRTGLTGAQVQEHWLHGRTNRAVEPPSKSVNDIIRENIFTYFNLIFAILALLLCIAGSFRDLTLLPVIVANTLIGIVQARVTLLGPMSTTLKGVFFVFSTFSTQSPLMTAAAQYAMKPRQMSSTMAARIFTTNNNFSLITLPIDLLFPLSPYRRSY